jgi:hypothetical protein
MGLFLPGVAFCSWVGEIIDGVNTYDRISNKYFYAAVGLLMVTLPALGRIRRGGQMRPVMAKSVATLLYTVNFICVTLLVIHFFPETSIVFDFCVDIIERVFN